MTTYDSACRSAEEHIRMACEELDWSTLFLAEGDGITALHAVAMCFRHLGQALRQCKRMEWAEKNGQGGPDE